MLQCRFFIGTTIFPRAFCVIQHGFYCIVYFALRIGSPNPFQRAYSKGKMGKTAKPMSGYTKCPWEDRYPFYRCMWDFHAARSSLLSKPSIPGLAFWVICFHSTLESYLMSHNLMCFFHTHASSIHVFCDLPLILVSFTYSPLILCIGAFSGFPMMYWNDLQSQPSSRSFPLVLFPTVLSSLSLFQRDTFLLHLWHLINLYCSYVQFP